MNAIEAIAMFRAGDRSFAAALVVVPLVAGVEAVLAIHRPDEIGRPMCRACGFPWPCTTARALGVES